MDDNKIPRPEKALKSRADLKVDMMIWEGYGLLNPFVASPMIVASEPMLFSDHRSYSDLHQSQKDHLVVDLQYLNDGRPAAGVKSTHFLSDMNLIPGHSHNDNYIFRSWEDAKEYVESVRKWWEEHPKQAEEARLEMARWRELDGWDYDDTDYVNYG